MRTKSIIIGIFIALLAIVPAHAQTGTSKTTSALITETNVLFPDNTSGAITPFNARQTLLDIIASYLNTQSTATLNGLLTFTGCGSGTSAFLCGGITSGGGPMWTWNETGLNPYFTAAAGGITGSTANTATIPSTTGITGDYIGAVATITCGTDNGDAQSITGYNAGLKQISIAPSAWAVAPDITSCISIGRIDYGWWRFVADGNALYFEDWQACNPLTSTVAFDCQDEFMRFVRAPANVPYAANHFIGLNYPITGIGARDFVIGTNYQDFHLPQTPRSMIFETLHNNGTTLVEALRLTPNNLVPTWTTPSGVNVGIGIGPTTSPTTALEVSLNPANTLTPIATTVLHLIGPNTTQTHTTLDTYAAKGEFAVRRANGTNALPSAIQLNDVIGGFTAYGFGSTIYSADERAAINMAADENWTDANQGTLISIAATPTTSTTQSTVMAVDGWGHTLPFSPRPPILSAGCVGAGSGLVAGSTDTAGGVVGNNAGATSCTITFAKQYTNAPFCVVTGETAPVITSTPSVASLIVSFNPAGNYKFSYICFGL